LTEQQVAALRSPRRIGRTRVRTTNGGTTFEEHAVGGLPAVKMARGYSESQCELIIGAGNGQGIVLLGELFVGEGETSVCDRLVTAAGYVVDAVTG
jgi:hypothetical protein